MKVNLFFNRKAWAEFNHALSHRHLFTSDYGYLTINGLRGTVTMLRCKCGHGEWFFQ
jgi:hypothetical protein